MPLRFLRIPKRLIGGEVVNYERTKQKMYKRYERANCSLDSLPHGLSWQEYTKWIDLASAAKTKYLLGEITAEEALEIIEVND